jgi:pyruvate/2-oxoacid:ferredoxin oxidoreductase alpha subunit
MSTGRLGAPWCLDPDQGDSLSQRDTGWLQIYCSGAQEVFDTILQAFALTEQICLCPAWWFTTASTFLIPMRLSMCRTKKPCGVSWEHRTFEGSGDTRAEANLHGLTAGDTQLKLVRERHIDMQGALDHLYEINKRFADKILSEVTARSKRFSSSVKTAVLAAGSCAETVRWSLPDLLDTGLIQLRALRPFPAVELRQILKSRRSEGGCRRS